MIRDLVAEGLAGGWKVTDASSLKKDVEVTCDVAIVGTGAGGGMAAEALSQAGLRVVMIEEGPLRSSTNFKMDETVAYPDLYQESAGRKTLDKAITILQGRCVGGGTTINWTSSFETPNPTLNHWGEAHGVEGCKPEEMKPWFQAVEQRLNIHSWPVTPNANNEVLRKGAEALGIGVEVMNRNVNGCVNSGFCGLGCPVNAKQSMLVTTIPTAMDRGAELFTRLRAAQLHHKGDRISHLTCEALNDRGTFLTGQKVRVTAKHYVMAGGAIGSPGVMLRSKLPDPHGLLGKRTFIHPVVISTAIMPEEIHPYYGAPQSIYSDDYLWKDGVTGPMGFKLEVPPLHPLISSTVLDGHGEAHARLMDQLPHLQGMLVLMRDGFHPESVGGQVKLKADGTPGLDYPLTDYIFEGMQRALMTMAEIQFAAGATSLMPMHRDITTPYTSWAQAKAEIPKLKYAPLHLKVFSAHVMGGCGMGEDPRSSVVDSLGSHHQIENLSVLDGSVFPTCIGTNPQVSIYAMTLKNVTALIQRLQTS